MYEIDDLGRQYESLHFMGFRILYISLDRAQYYFAIWRRIPETLQFPYSARGIGVFSWKNTYVVCLMHFGLSFISSIDFESRCNSQQIWAARISEMRNFNITLGLMQTYLTFYESLPELVKYAANMKGIVRIMQIPRVWRSMCIELPQPIWDAQKTHPSYNC